VWKQGSSLGRRYDSRHTAHVNLLGDAMLGGFFKSVKTLNIHGKGDIKGKNNKTTTTTTTTTTNNNNNNNNKILLLLHLLKL
jgi:hypothetical protein